MSPTVPTVVIIGAGFSGTVLAAQLLRYHRRGPLRVVMVNRSGLLARGVAYGTRSSRHVLNVPAGRMSAIADDEDHFLSFARQRDPSIGGGTFVPRRLYGEYLEDVMLSAQTAASPGTVVEHVADEALAVRMRADGKAAQVLLGHAGPITAERVVLALGNYAPADPPLADPSFFQSARYVRDPWASGALERVPPDAPVLLIGTGLTMIDVVLELQARGRSASCLAVSRRGLVPQPHRPHTAPPSYAHLPPELVACGATAVDYLRVVRRHVRRLARQGIDWREVVASLRPVTPRLWQALDDEERARFLRHLRPYWEVHRHRMAPELWHAFQSLVVGGEVLLLAARLEAAREDGDGARVTLQHRGSSRRDEVRVGMVVNCSGPASDVRQIRDPLIADLLASGLAVADDQGLGLQSDDDYALVDPRGHPSRVLSLVGPLLKGRYWEATAVPELRVHAARLAVRLAQELARASERMSA